MESSIQLTRPMKAQKSLSGLIALAAMLLPSSIFLLCFCLWRNSHTSALVESKVKNPRAKVLLFSMPDSIYGFRLQEDGLRGVLMQNDINLDVEFFEPNDFDFLMGGNGEYVRERLQTLDANNYDVIVSSGTLACYFISENYETYFKDKTVIFISPGSQTYFKDLRKNKNYYGFIESNLIADTIRAAKKMYPSAKKFVGIYDNTSNGCENWSEFVRQSKIFPRIDFSGYDTSLLTREELLHKISLLQNDAVLFFLGAATDSSGKLYSLESQIDFLVSSTDLPIFTANAVGLGHGIIGGQIIDYKKMGQEVGELIVKIADREKIPSRIFKMEDGYFVVDQKTLAAHNIKNSVVPENSTIVNSQTTQYMLYGIIIGAMGIVISLVFFVVISWVYIISESRRKKDMELSHSRMEYLVQHDYLTKLPNRYNIVNIFNSLKSENRNFSLVLLDIDDFKTINDLYSHSCGDEVLREVSNRLLNFAEKENFFVSRFGGDEFLLFYLKGFLDESSDSITKMKRIFETPVVLAEKKINLNVSYGVVNSKDESLEVMIANADIALYHAKKMGRNQLVFFDGEMKNRIQEVDSISKVIDEAIDCDGIEVVYQPQIDLAKKEIYGYEALMRLRDKKISPAKFIPIAEDSGQIIKIDRILTEKVVKQMYTWREHGLPLKKVSINFSAAQLADPSYVDFLAELLNRYEIPTEYIGIEITESIFVSDKDEVLKFLDKFVQKGIFLSLDDFGTGYSSLSYLTFLPISVVKIDKSIVDNYLTDKNSSFIQNITRLVHGLGMKLTVEGVEYDWQVEKLNGFSCDYIQGYFYSRPISGVDVESFFKNFRG